MGAAKTKAAVLEGMEESSATLTSDYGNISEAKMIPLYPLSCDFRDVDGPRFFMVICTENIFGDEEGTFPNPVAQLDRTTIAINMTDPVREEDELKIVARNVVGKRIENTAKTAGGNFFEDFRVGQEFRHATPRTLTEAAERLHRSKAARELFGNQLAHLARRLLAHLLDAFVQRHRLVRCAALDDLLALCDHTLCQLFRGFPVPCGF